MKRKGINLILIGWVLVLVVMNLVWLGLDKTPPAWDQAAHLRSIVWFNYFLQGKFWGNFRDLLRVFWGYPPLIYFLGGLWSLVFGVGIVKITFINTFFLVAGVYGVYSLAKEVSKNNLVALLAAIIFSLFPVIGDISRNMLLDLPLLVWVVWGWYFWLKSDDLKNKKESWLLLLMLVLASLTKLNGFLYFVPVLIVLVVKSFKNIDILVKLVIGGLVYMVAVGWWWVGNWTAIYGYLTGLAGQGESLTDPMNLMEWQTWTHYLKLMVLHQIGPITFFVGLFLIFWVPKKNKKNILLLITTILVYIIFTVVKNKDFRFTLPILVPMAIWMAWGGMELFKKVRVLSLGILILLIGWLGFNFMENGFGWPIKKPVVISTKSFLFEDIDWIGFDDYPVRQIKNNVWPVETIVHDLSEIISNNEETQNVLGLIDLEELNNSNLNLYKLILNDNQFNLDTLGGMMTGFSMETEILEVINKNDYFLVPEIGYEATPFYATHLKANNELRDWIWRNINRFEILREYQLPNQKKVYLLKKMEI